MIWRRWYVFINEHSSMIWYDEDDMCSYMNIHPWYDKNERWCECSGIPTKWVSVKRVCANSFIHIVQSDHKRIIGDNRIYCEKSNWQKNYVDVILLGDFYDRNVVCVISNAQANLKSWHMIKTSLDIAGSSDWLILNISNNATFLACAYLESCFLGRIFLILRRNFPNVEEDFPNIDEKFS